MRPTKGGILGTANIAIERVIPGMAETGSAVAYAIGARGLDKAKSVASQLGIPAAYGSYEAVLEDPPVAPNVTSF